MKRLTFEGNFCDIAMCQENPDSFCKDGPCSQRKVWERLKHYEDMEEQGRLVLPCKPGDKVYRVVRWGKGKVAIRERVVSSVEYNAAGEWVIHSTGDDVLSKRCFLTREEAERALKGGANQ